MWESPGEELAGAVLCGTIDDLSIFLIEGGRKIGAHGVGAELGHRAKAAHQKAILHGNGIEEAHWLNGTLLVLESSEHIGELIIGGGDIQIQIFQPVLPNKGAETAGIRILILDGIDAQKHIGILHLAVDVLVSMDDGGVVGHISST